MKAETIAKALGGQKLGGGVKTAAIGTRRLNIVRTLVMLIAPKSAPPLSPPAAVSFSATRRQQPTIAPTPGGDGQSFDDDISDVGRS